MRAALLITLLSPIGLNAQEIDKQKLLEMLRLPKSTLSPGFESKGDQKGPQLSGEAEWIKAEIVKLKKTLKHEPSDWLIWKEIEEKTAKLDDPTQGRKAVEEEFACIKAWLVQHPTDQQALLDLTDVLLGLEKVDEAFANAQVLVKQYPGQSSAWVKLGRCYRAKNSFGQFTNAFTKAISLAPNDPDVHLEYASHVFDYASACAFGEDPMMSDRSLEELQNQITGQSSGSHSKDAGAKEKSTTIPSSFIPPKKLVRIAEGTTAQSNNKEEILKNFNKVREEAQLAAKLFRQRDPSNRDAIFALLLYHAADAFEHPLTTEIKSQVDCMKQADVVTELKRVIKLRPDDIPLHFLLFLSKYVSTFDLIIRDHRLNPEAEFSFAFRLKKVLTDAEWQEFDASLRLEDQLNNMPSEQAVFAHNALRTMGMLVGELEFAIKHARYACDLAPENAENWNTLAGLLVLSGQAGDVLALKDKWLQHHSTAETHFLLAKAAEKVNDWKLVRHHVEEGLKLDPQHVKLLYSQIVAELKNDNLAAAQKVALDRVKYMRDLLWKNEGMVRSIDNETIRVIGIVVHALNGDFDGARQGLDWGLYYFPQNAEFIKLQQLLGVAGLQPPSLRKP